MTIQVDLKPEMESWLVAGAQARGAPVEKHAEAPARAESGFFLVGCGLEVWKTSSRNSHLLSFESKYFVRDISWTSSCSHKDNGSSRPDFLRGHFTAPIHSED